MKAVEFATSQKGCWRNIAITLIDRVVSVVAGLDQQSRAYLWRLDTEGADVQNEGSAVTNRTGKLRSLISKT
jgi:hypothetical protein